MKLYTTKIKEGNKKAISKAKQQQKEEETRKKKMKAQALRRQK